MFRWITKAMAWDSYARFRDTDSNEFLLKG